MKKVVILVVVILIAIQFYRPDKNIAETSSYNSIEKHYTVPANVSLLLKTSCYDCHSNNTQYPWYNNIQPVAWWLNKHIIEGKKELNFDEFNNYSSTRKKKKLNEIIEEIEKNDMPLHSYTFIHKDAVLTPEQQKQIIDWAKKLKNSIPD